MYFEMIEKLNQMIQSATIWGLEWLNCSFVSVWTFKVIETCLYFHKLIINVLDYLYVTVSCSNCHLFYLDISFLFLPFVGLKKQIVHRPKLTELSQIEKEPDLARLQRQTYPFILMLGKAISTCYIGYNKIQAKEIQKFKCIWFDTKFIPKSFDFLDMFCWYDLKGRREKTLERKRRR